MCQYTYIYIYRCNLGCVHIVCLSQSRWTKMPEIPAAIDSVEPFRSSTAVGWETTLKNHPEMKDVPLSPLIAGSTGRNIQYTCIYQKFPTIVNL